MKLFVENLSPVITDQELKDIFGLHGKVKTARVAVDEITRESKGYGFVEMSDRHARNAMYQLDGTEIRGRVIEVRQAKHAEQGVGKMKYSGREGQRRGGIGRNGKSSGGTRPPRGSGRSEEDWEE